MRLTMKDVPPLPAIEGWEVRHLPGWTGYAVGSNGSVWSCKKMFGRGAGEWRRLTPVVKESGHLRIQLTDHERRVKMCVHTAVLITFVGPRPPGMESRHFPDWNPANNTIHNLSWATDKQNVADCVEMGRHRTGNIAGESNPMATLTDEKVRRIHALCESGRLPDIATQFGVSQGVVSLICRGLAWRHLNLPPLRSFHERYDRSGENNAAAKLDKRTVLIIRERYAKREANQPQLAAEYGVTQALVSAIIRRRIWRSV